MQFSKYINSNVRALDNNYAVEVDRVNKVNWHNYLKSFIDANIYQTWSYESVRSSNSNISHLLLKKNGIVVSLCQARIVKIPLFNIGIAYIRWGPIWRLKGEKEDMEIFIQSIRALRNEYVCKRKLYLRIVPTLFNEDTEKYNNIFYKEGFMSSSTAERQRTLIVNLSLSLEELRKGFEQKWRNCLNRAERSNVNILSGDNEELFDSFSKIYYDMLERKKFSSSTNLNHFKYINIDLPNDFRSRIFICLENDIPSSGAICNAVGDTAIYLFGATNGVGMKNNGSYLIQWEIIKWLKNIECNWYNLHGINKEKNPGTYHFKLGLCGKNGQEKQYIGQYNAYRNNLSYYFVEVGEFILSHYRGIFV